MVFIINRPPGEPNTYHLREGSILGGTIEIVDDGGLMYPQVEVGDIHIG